MKRWRADAFRRCVETLDETLRRRVNQMIDAGKNLQRCGQDQKAAEQATALLSARDRTCSTLARHDIRLIFNPPERAVSEYSIPQYRDAVVILQLLVAPRPTMN
jgi:hypothetical protein